MLTKIKDGWWVDLSRIVNFYSSKEKDQTWWYIDGSTFTYQANYEEGQLLEKKLEEYYRGCILNDPINTVGVE